MWSEVKIETRDARHDRNNVGDLFASRVSRLASRAPRGYTARMPPAATTRHLDRLTLLRAALERKGTLRRAQRMINSMHSAEIASLLESLPPAKRELVWGFVDPELEGDVLVELNEE